MSESLTAIFPLNIPLFPECEIPLQIFERRYIDMVSQCMRNGTGFVVTLLQPGSESYEVMRKGPKPEQLQVPFFTTGTSATIVDFEQRDNGLLGITIKGINRQNLSDIRCQDDGLWLGDSTLRPEQNSPTKADLSNLKPLLKQLLEINGLAALMDTIDCSSSSQVMNYLITLLPFGSNTKQSLLEIDDLSVRLQQTIEMLEGLQVSQINH